MNEIEEWIKVFGADAIEELINDMTWVIGYVTGLEEKLMDAVNEGDISHRSACWIADEQDERFATDFSTAIHCMKRVR